MHMKVKPADQLTADQLTADDVYYSPNDTPPSQPNAIMINDRKHRIESELQKIQSLVIDIHKHSASEKTALLVIAEQNERRDAIKKLMASLVGETTPAGS